MELLCKSYPRTFVPEMFLTFLGIPYILVGHGVGGGVIHGTVFVRVIPAHQGGVEGELCFIKMC